MQKELITGYYNENYTGRFPCYQLFIDEFGEIPSVLEIEGVEVDAIKSLMASNNLRVLSSVSDYDIKDRLIDESYKLIRGDSYYLYLNIFPSDTARVFIYYKQDDEDIINEIANLLAPAYVEPKEEPEEPKEAYMSLLGTDRHGELSLKQYKLTQVDLDIDLFYGETFGIKYEEILKKISTDNHKGLVLFHGKPGTGKTTLLRKLIYDVCEDKKVMYLPPDMVTSITDPSFITFLSQYPNSILVIEDAENVLQKRSENVKQSVANLLNLTDGLLSDCLRIQVICTFNTELEKIDPALLRKGRLIAKHDFDLLTKEQAKSVCERFGIDFEPTRNMSLADIFAKQDVDLT